MIFTIALFSLLIATAACLALSSVVATRWLSWGAALVCAGSALLLAVAPAADTPPVVLLDLGDVIFSLTPQLSGVERGLAAGALAAGAAALLALGTALAASVRGFGPIVGWAVLALAAVLLSLAAPPTSLVHPLSWAVGALASYAAVRASGVLVRNETPPYGVMLGLVATALLLGVQTRINPALAVGEQPPALAAAGALLAVLALVGAAPLGLARSENLVAPAPLGVLVHTLVLPTMGLAWLLRLIAELPIVPFSWAVALGLIGAATALAGAGRVVASPHLRDVLGGLAMFQIGLIVTALGLADPIASVAGLALLLNMLLAGVVGAVAVAALERNSGSDDYTADGPRLPGVGVLWALCAAVALGLPPFWGVWGRIWLLESALVILPWLTPALLAASVLAVAGALAPLIRFWGPASAPPANALGPVDWLAALAPAGVGVLFGVAPQIAWAVWLSDAPFAPVTAPFGLGARVAVVGLGVLLGGMAWLIGRAPSGRSVPVTLDTPAVRMGLDALGASLAPLVAFGRPTTLFGLLWTGLERLSQGARFVMGAFEQRYYLLGVLMALIFVMLLMAQL
jgi:hypothetical protein